MERLRKALFVALSGLLVAAPAGPNPAFRFKTIHIENLIQKVDHTVVFDPGNLLKGGYHPPAEQTLDDLEVLESGKFLTWSVDGDFANVCWTEGIASNLAIIYVPNGSKSGSVSCDGEIDQSRKVFEATYESNTSITGKSLELTGTLTGHVKYFDRSGDEQPTFDDVGTIKQHAKFEISAARCNVLLYETESRVRVSYQDQDGGGHDIEDSVWVIRSGPATTCELG